MELRWVLLCISIIIIALVAWHTSRSSFVVILNYVKKLIKREDQLDLFSDDSGQESETEAPDAPEGIVCLHIKAKPGKHFGGQQLLIHLNRAGLHYGDMNIFHYTPANAPKSVFSLASAFEPGTFDIDRMDNFSTEGLALFMQTNDQEHPADALDSLLDIAEELSEKLDGDLLDHRWHMLTEDQVDAYYSALN